MGNITNEQITTAAIDINKICNLDPAIVTDFTPTGRGAAKTSQTKKFFKGVLDEIIGLATPDKETGDSDLIPDDIKSLDPITIEVLMASLNEETLAIFFPVEKDVETEDADKKADKKKKADAAAKKKSDAAEKKKTDAAAKKKANDANKEEDTPKGKKRGRLLTAAETVADMGVETKLEDLAKEANKRYIAADGEDNIKASRIQCRRSINIIMGLESAGYKVTK